MDKINSDLLIYILLFLDNIQCCQKSTLNKLRLVEKYIKNIIDNNNLIDKFKVIKFNAKQQSLYDMKILCLYHSGFNKEEGGILSSLTPLGPLSLHKIYVPGDGHIPDSTFCHFDTVEKMDQFQWKCDRLEMRLTFSRKCCGGKGSKVIFTNLYNKNNKNKYRINTNNINYSIRKMGKMVPKKLAPKMISISNYLKIIFEIPKKNKQYKIKHKKTKKYYNRKPMRSKKKINKTYCKRQIYGKIKNFRVNK